MPYRSIFRPGLFSGQSVIVTGGGSGIGRCTAHELTALGARVALVGRKIGKLEKVRAEIAEVGGSADCYVCDIREEPAVQATVGAIIKAHGRIDGLVNNAGGQYPAPAEKISFKGWEAVVRNNLTGGFLFSRECYTQWMDAHGGAIVNIIADMWNGMPNMAHSGAARAGMLNFTETVACEWARSGVRVNAVAPGWIASSGFDTYDDSMKERLKSYARMAPLKRFGTESEIAAAIVFLLSEAAAYISGACLRVDGAVPNAPVNFTIPDHANSKPFNGFHLASLPKFLSE